MSCIGGGPAGLLLGILLHRSGRGDVTVYERNAPDDTFGFGVVFSDETLSNLRSADPEVFDRIEQEFAYWPTMDVVHRGRLLRSGGHGFAAMSRQRLLSLLIDRAVELGVDVRHRTEIAVGQLPADADLVVICDGVNSAHRNALASSGHRSSAARRSTSGSAPRSTSPSSRSCSPRPSGASSRRTCTRSRPPIPRS
ncbi:MAG: anthraniloyl-CoA monooxygenase [Acidimicrobiaceae bacterium]|nr:MAG: anthraniloyl-CoA monooxygenase [Acidimicrobiaceae bacterium]